MKVTKAIRKFDNEYNVITVTEKNMHTGNHSVSVSSIKNGKPFKFIDINGEVINIASNFEICQYIKTHPKCKKWKAYPQKDSNTGEVVKTGKYPYYLIPDKYAA